MRLYDPSPLITALVAVLALSCAGADAPAAQSARATAAEPILTAPAAAPIASPPATESRDAVGRFTGGRTRIVWTADAGDGRDIIGQGSQLLLMGYDSHDGPGERVILSKPSSYAKPLVTPRGDRILFSDRTQDLVFVVSWDGSGLREVARGFALAAWKDPQTNVEWVYVGTDQTSKDPPSYGTVRRHQLDRPDVTELVWNKRPVTADSFQLSRDGRLGGGVFPWPTAGIVELPNGNFRELGEGCWTALAADDSHLFWYFDGSHRNLTVVDVDAAQRWQVNITGAPGIDRYEVYHPRWSNHPRFLVLTGPYTVGAGANKIRGGGRQVEIHIGKFAADYRSVSEWIRVTHNETADFSPDVWIDPQATSTPATARTAGPAPASTAPSAASSARPGGRLVVEARVLAESPVPTPRSIAPYKHALLAVEYEPVRVLEGTYEGRKLLAAHWVIRDAAVLRNAARPAGSVHLLTLEPYDTHPELEGERLVMDSREFTLRLYYDVGSAR